MPTAVSMLEAFGRNFPGLNLLLTMLAYLLGMEAGASASHQVPRDRPELPARRDGSQESVAPLLRA